MAIHRTLPTERLDIYALDQYGSITSKGILTICFANLNVWRGEGEFEGGKLLNFPDALQDFPYNTEQVTSDMQSIRDRFNEVEPLIPRTGTNSINHDTGEFASQYDAVCQAVKNRILNIKETFWLHPEFGTTVFDDLGQTLNSARVQIIIDKINNELIKDVDWYRVETITGFILNYKTVQVNLTILHDGIGTIPIELVLTR